MDLTHQHNLQAIQRRDAEAKEILHTTSYTALYYLDANSKSWSRAQAEGTLFLYKRAGNPSHAALLLNRLSTSDVVIYLNSPLLELESASQRFVFVYSSGKVYGFWFHDMEAAKIFFAKLSIACSTKKIEIPEFKPISEESSSLKPLLQLDDILFDEVSKVLRKSEVQSKISESSLISPELLLSSRVSKQNFEKAIVSVISIPDVIDKLYERYVQKA